MFKGIITYFKGLLQPDSKDSMKSFAMFSSVLVGIFLGISLGIALLIDVMRDGVLDSDMMGCSAYVVSIGAMITLSAVPKMVVDKAKVEMPILEDKPKRRGRKKKDEEEDLEELG